MAGHSRPKDGVLSHAYVAGIHVFMALQTVKTWMAGTSPAMTSNILQITTISVRPRASGDPGKVFLLREYWIPACAGMSG
jgi:hypothetical protein